MPINKNELAKEEAEVYLAELTDYELDSGEIKRIAGGGGTVACKARIADPW